MAQIITPAPLGVRKDLIGHLPQLRAALEQQRRFRIEQLAELDSAIGTDAEITIDPRRELDRITRADAGSAIDPKRQVMLALRAGAASALVDTEIALYRMDTGEYGRCRRCGTTIPLERLEILPSVARCMACQHAQEVSPG